MIDINKLTEKDKGRWVKYTDGSGRSELGRLKSWNDTFIFVVYKCGDEWYRFFDYTGQATRPSSLCFIYEKETDIYPTQEKIDKERMNSNKQSKY